MTSRFPPVALPDTRHARTLQAFCLDFEGAYEDYPWGDIVYKVGAKMFAALGVGGGLDGLTVKATPEDAAVLVQLPFITSAKYVGRHGWVTILVEDETALDLARELIGASYALVAPKKGRRRRSP